MKDAVQVNTDGFDSYDRAGKRLMLISSGLDVLTVMQTAIESKDEVSPQVLSDTLFFVKTVLEEQAEGLINDVDELMKATKEKA